jgi:hypothetical protein
MSFVERFRFPGLAAVLALLAFSPSSAIAQTCSQTLSAGSNVGSAISSAAAGSTICLSNGNYAGFSLDSVSKSPRVTVRAVNSKQASFTSRITFNNSSSGMTFDGVNFAGIFLIGTGIKDFTFSNADASKGSIEIDGSTVANPNLLFENLTQYKMDDTDFCSAQSINCADTEAGFRISYGRSNKTPVATIRGMIIDGGCADGIKTGAPIIVENSIIQNKLNGTCGSGPHVDAMQFFGGPFSGSIIRGNFWNNNTQVLTAYDGVDGVLIENNVFDPGTSPERRPCQIEWYSDNSSIIRHNTILYRGDSYGLICLDRKSTDPAGFGTIVVDNIANAISTGNGSTYAQRYNNLVRSGAIAGERSGVPTFIGGVTPTTYAGFGLTAGSLGKVVGSTPPGSDIGITSSAASTTLQPPSNLIAR